MMRVRLVTQVWWRKQIYYYSSVHAFHWQFHQVSIPWHLLFHGIDLVKIQMHNENHDLRAHQVPHDFSNGAMWNAFWDEYSCCKSSNDYQIIEIDSIGEFRLLTFTPKTSNHLRSNFFLCLLHKASWSVFWNRFTLWVGARLLVVAASCLQ